MMTMMRSLLMCGWGETEREGKELIFHFSSLCASPFGKSFWIWEGMAHFAWF